MTTPEGAALPATQIRTALPQLLTADLIARAAAAVAAAGCNAAIEGFNAYLVATRADRPTTGSAIGYDEEEWSAFKVGHALAQHPAEPVRAPTVEAVHAMGASGSPAVEAERLAFEAWMRGHCWALSAVWTGTGYQGTAESPSYVCPLAMGTRRMWAAWRDRAALATRPAAPESIQWGDPARQALRDRFLAWARKHLGQGYSLAIDDDSPTFTDPVTLGAEVAYIAGLAAAPEPQAANHIDIAVLRDALQDALSACSSVHTGGDRRITRDGCVMYLQTEEWCRWLEDEIAPKLRAMLAATPAGNPPAAVGGDGNG